MFVKKKERRKTNKKKTNISLNIEMENISWFTSPQCNRRLPGTFVILSMVRLPRGDTLAYTTLHLVINSREVQNLKAPSCSIKSKYKFLMKKDTDLFLIKREKIKGS